ncbi:MAG TPA: hypothetical protein ENH52_00235 [Nitrospirae bacterium]|nr:hypothetical protein [Nitrospirota bacterium]
MLKHKLCYFDEDQWIEVPEWGSFYIDLGFSIPDIQNLKDRSIIGLAVPTRAFCASLIASGIVLSRSKKASGNSGDSDYFEFFKTLNKGTPILYRLGKNGYKGFFEGIYYEDEEPRVRVKVKKGKQEISTAEMSLKEAGNRICVNGDKKDLNKTSSGRRLSYKGDFLESCLDETDPFKFTAKSYLECVIYGRINTLREEIKETPFAFKLSNEEYKQGILQDILRVRKFMGEGSAYRSNIFPVEREALQTIQSRSLTVVIFDGATGFLKWRDYLRGFDWIVILDRTEPYFHDAIDQLNQEYIENRISEKKLENVTSLPPGVEMVVFQEGRE